MSVYINLNAAWNFTDWVEQFFFERIAYKAGVQGTGGCRFQFLFSLTDNFAWLWIVGMYKIESAENFCKWPLELYLETHSTFLRLTDMTTTRVEDIDLESGENVPFGHNWEFDL